MHLKWRPWCYCQYLKHAGKSDQLYTNKQLISVISYLKKERFVTQIKGVNVIYRRVKMATPASIVMKMYCILCL